jgi:predicted kinase
MNPHPGQPVPPPGPLVVLVGPAGCGKFRWAKGWYEDHRIVSTETLRVTVCGVPYNPDADPHTARIRAGIVEARMRFGLPTVVDADPRYRNELAVKSLYRPGPVAVPSILVVFDTPLRDCQTANARRRFPVPPRVVRDQHTAIAHELPVGSTWLVHPFTTGVRVRPDGMWRMDGAGTCPDVPWLRGLRSIQESPDWVGPADGHHSPDTPRPWRTAPIDDLTA